MAEVKTVSVVPLNERNYPTWKVQCRMALIKDGLWGIVSGTETDPGETRAEERRQFLKRRDRALATIVLSVEPSLLYLLGDPEDPVAVWQKLKDHFQRKTWANKLELRRKLYALRLKEGESVQRHVKRMTEIFEELSVIDDPISEEDKVVHLLASLPDSFNMLVTALEANSESVPKMEIVTERLLHEEQKQKGKVTEDVDTKALALKGKPKKHLTCHFCRKPGHIKRECWKLAQLESAGKKPNKLKHTANKAAEVVQSESSSGDEVLVVDHALSASSKDNWIIDSGATSHMCHNEALFSELKALKKPQDVSLGDGHVLKAVAEGTVSLKMLLDGGTTKRCSLKRVLLIPKLAYNLLSVSKATEAGKTVDFDETGCKILNADGRCIASGTKVGNLYYLKVSKDHHHLTVAAGSNKERLWHRRYGHLSEQNLQMLTRNGLVECFDYDLTNSVGFCEACIGGKHHRSRF